MTATLKPTSSTLLETLRTSTARIAPIWPLENFVAVNPYFGMSDFTFSEVALRLQKVAGAKMTLPLRYYLSKIKEGEILSEDLAKAIQTFDQVDLSPEDFVNQVRALDSLPQPISRIPTVGGTAALLTEHDWGQLADQRIAAWAASYFDKGQALWSAVNKDDSAYASWKREACLDRTPRVMGLPGVRKAAAALPNDPLLAAAEALKNLGIPEEAQDVYFQCLLMRLGGWSATAALRNWDAELAGSTDNTLVEILCIRLAWESILLKCVNHPDLQEQWEERLLTLTQLASESTLPKSLVHALVLQEAYDQSEHRRLDSLFEGQNVSKATGDEVKLLAQAVFCIDVRSEVFRRNLETVSSDIATLGFAGFFAFPIAIQPLGHASTNAQCPVLLTPGFTMKEGTGSQDLDAEVIRKRTVAGHLRRAWASFKMGAISCFSFVGPVGLAYLPKLFTDGFGLTRPVRLYDDEGLEKEMRGRRSPQLDKDGVMGMTLEERVALGAGALTAMSLTDNFAPLVLIVGHGSSTVNNPHATGLDCGACGGRTGEANARVAAGVLNDPEVRTELKLTGINLPDQTFFLACQHDTTTDEVQFFNHEQVPAELEAGLSELRIHLAQAGKLSRSERAKRFQLDPGTGSDRAVMSRSRDWAQVRPEWGLAGCSAFIVAPRFRTTGLNLKGRSFLHSYEWEQDEGFGVLELIMTAPMVVASWISLQYYASTVDNTLFGSGNKTLHNVVGRVGVLEGNAGDLRVGLPWQSVHDGEGFQHLPHRLQVIIEAPNEAVTAVIEKHQLIRNLCDNGWLYLSLLDEHGKIGHRYAGNLKWE